jgi:hypothetical protein
LGAGMEAVWLDRWQLDVSFCDNDRVHRVGTATEYFLF